MRSASQGVQRDCTRDRAFSPENVQIGRHVRVQGTLENAEKSRLAEVLNKVGQCFVIGAGLPVAVYACPCPGFLPLGLLFAPTLSGQLNI